MAVDADDERPVLGPPPAMPAGLWDRMLARLDDLPLIASLLPPGLGAEPGDTQADLADEEPSLPGSADLSTPDPFTTGSAPFDVPPPYEIGGFDDDRE